MIRHWKLCACKVAGCHEKLFLIYFHLCFYLKQIFYLGPTGSGSIEIPVLCMLISGDANMLEVRKLSNTFSLNTNTITGFLDSTKIFHPYCFTTGGTGKILCQIQGMQQQHECSSIPIVYVSDRTESCVSLFQHYCTLYPALIVKQFVIILVKFAQNQVKFQTV